MNQSNICRDIQKIEPLIRNCLPIAQKIYQITKRLKTPSEVEHYFPGFIAFIDSTTEQQIPRPVDKRRRTVYYSGKKRKHTIKTQLIVNNHGFIIYKLVYKKDEGMIMISIKRIIPSCPKMLLMYLIRGYLGIEKDFPQQISSIPNRKERNLQSSVEQKEFNRGHAKKRIAIEHTICRLKKYRILAHVFRNRLNKHNKISDIVSGLVNYRIMKQQN